MKYVSGQKIWLQATFVDLDGAYVDPTAITLYVTTPTEVTTTYLKAVLTRPSAGIYGIAVSVAVAGIWQWGVRSTGVGQAAEQGWFEVMPWKASSLS